MGAGGYLRPIDLISDFDTMVSQVTVTTTATLIAPADSGRVSLALANRGGVDIVVQPSRITATGQGWVIPLDGELRVHLFRDLGPLVGYEWYALVAAGSHSLTVVSVSFRPER